MFLNKGKCQSCENNCDECTDKENCFQCKEGFVLNSDKKCNDKCPVNSVLISDKCVQCKTFDSNCAKCSEDALDNCTGCADGFYLLNNECVKNCPLGYFLNDRNKCQSKLQVFFYL
jgi:proprotein convertase subtilisin/kexin type 5